MSCSCAMLTSSFQMSNVRCGSMLGTLLHFFDRNKSVWSSLDNMPCASLLTHAELSWLHNLLDMLKTAVKSRNVSCKTNTLKGY